MWIQQTAESMTIVGGDMPTRPPLLVCDYIACHSTSIHVLGIAVA